MPDLFPQLLIKSNCTHNTNFPNFGKLRRQIRCETNLSMLSKSSEKEERGENGSVCMYACKKIENLPSDEMWPVSCLFLEGKEK